jgi:mono/diheme cytochrome c family protein
MKKHLVSGLSVFVLTAAAGSAADAPATWGQNCTSCHGSDGAGHTKAGKLLGAMDLTDAAHQKSFTDDQAFAAIKDGFKDSSGKVKMTPFSGKLTDDEIKALVAYTRTLSK